MYGILRYHSCLLQKRGLRHSTIMSAKHASGLALIDATLVSCVPDPWTTVCADACFTP